MERCVACSDRHRSVSAYLFRLCCTRASPSKELCHGNVDGDDDYEASACLVRKSHQSLDSGECPAVETLRVDTVGNVVLDAEKAVQFHQGKST